MPRPDSQSPAPAPRPIHLVPHPATPAGPVEALSVALSIRSPGELFLTYRLEGDMSRVRLILQGEPGRADGLWRHTCCEAFIRRPGSRGYYELNISPSCRWAAYEFADYRDGMRPWELAHGPVIATSTAAEHFELVARLVLPADAGDLRAAPLALGAVIEDDSGRLSYWSVRHAAGKPDFHHPDAFATELPRTFTQS